MILGFADAAAASVDSHRREGGEGVVRRRRANVEDEVEIMRCGEKGEGRTICLQHRAAAWVGIDIMKVLKGEKSFAVRLLCSCL